MIPKIAYFHWAKDGPEFNWLRRKSIESFSKFNPDWDIRLIDTHETIKPFGLSYAHQADWSWWKAITKEGGFQIATDCIFIRKVPEIWLEGDLAATFNGFHTIFQFAMLGCSINNRFIQLVESETNKRVLSKSPSDLSYQELGTDLFQSVPLIYYKEAGEIFDIPMESTCPIPCQCVDILWEDKELDFSYSDNVVCVHWYGGHDSSRNLEWSVKEGSPHAIVRLAERVTK